MALIKCPECAKEVSDKANTCPHCGVKIVQGIGGPRGVKAKSSFDQAMTLFFWGPLAILAIIWLLAKICGY